MGLGANQDVQLELVQLLDLGDNSKRFDLFVEVTLGSGRFHVLRISFQMLPKFKLSRSAPPEFIDILMGLER